MYKEIIYFEKMKFLCLVLALGWVRKVTPLHCRCTGAYCDSPVLDTCYTIHACITETVGGNTTYGCTPFANYEKLYCGLSTKFRKTKCCKTDLCNSKGFPAKPYIPVPTIKLASVVKRIVTVNITDSFHIRAKISGYVATMYVPGENTRKLKYLSAYTRNFTFNHLYVNTTFVIEVSSYRGRLASERSKAIKFRNGAPECDYYMKGESGKNTESCHNFGCYAVWGKNGTALVLQHKGCWNDVSKSECFHLSPRGSSVVTHVMCTCNTRSCTPNTQDPKKLII